jgi:aspartyl-tRNA(Asn)/glutamyl-tRNA(Gln) amidotransferase subunit B
LRPEWIARVRADLPELPQARRERFAREYGLAPVDVELLTAAAPLADYFERLVAAHPDAKASANWVMGEVLAALNASGGSIADFPVHPTALARLLDLIRDGAVSHSAAKRIFEIMMRSGDPAEVIASREGLLQVRDADELSRWVDEVFAAHPVEAQRFMSGERKLQGVLVGMVMKRSGGRADPKRVNQLLAERAGGG